jgi:hypothetical protein
VRNQSECAPAFVAAGSAPSCSSRSTSSTSPARAASCSGVLPAASGSVRDAARRDHRCFRARPGDELRPIPSALGSLVTTSAASHSRK